MRWLFLLLLVLNGCYLVWNLQDVPVRAKDITSATHGAKGNQGIQLLSESGGTPLAAGTPGCVFVGGYADRAELKPIVQRLRDANLPLQAYTLPSATGEVEHWMRLPADATSPEVIAEQLARDINGLKHKIIRCEGIATPEQFE